MPARFRKIAEDVSQAEYTLDDAGFEEGLKRWVDGLGEIRSARFYPLADNRVRYEIASAGQYRVGVWKQVWSGDSLTEFAPIEETLVTARETRFRDITSHVFGGVESFDQQLLRGIPHWRARLDLATGIDVYGNNGIAAGDIDNDGRDEIYVCQPGGLPNRLYKNVNGHMQDITAQAGVDVLDDTSCALFLDLRNSGVQDLVVLRASGPLLFLNDGTGKFTFKANAFRFRAAAQGTFTGMAAADFDRDGKIDLYLCSYIYFQGEDQYRYPVPYFDAQNGPPNFLFRNNGDATFDDVTEATGLNQNNNRYSFAPAWCDYDGDGWPDLYVANDFGRNNLYKNNRGHFTDVAAAAGVEDLGPGMSAAWFDYDGDGRPDLYTANMWTDAGQRIVHDGSFPLRDAAPEDVWQRHSKGNSLFRNRGDGTFAETGPAEGVEMGRWAWSSDAHDFDNDGSPEILVTCGMLTNSSEIDLESFFWRQVVAKSPRDGGHAPAYENGWNALNQLIREDYSWSGRQPNVHYVQRDGRFYDFSGVSGFDFADDSRAFAVTDLDGDGNLDVLLKSRLGPQVRALQNNCGKARHAIAFNLRGTKSNWDAIGARVEVDGQMKLLQAGSGYLSQHTKRLHFGLGLEKTAKRVQITWPSGATQVFEDLDAGFRYRIIEGHDKPQRVAFESRVDVKNEPVSPDNQSRAFSTWLLDPVPLPLVRKGPAVVRFEEVPAELALLRRYLFDWRKPVEPPLSVLIDGRNMVHKVYAGEPGEAEAARDLRQLADPGHGRLALPFAGRYYAEPHRNYYRLGAAFLAAGYSAEALPYMEEALRRNPENSLALMAAGQIDLDAGRLDAARNRFEQGVRLNPNSADAWNGLGGVEAAAGQYRKALGHYEKALSLRSDLPFVLNNAAQAYAKVGDYAKAEEMLRRALAIDAKDVDAANQLGLVLAKQNRTDEARRLFQQAITLRRDHAGAINNLGVLYLQLNQVNDAIASFQYGIEMSPESDILYVNLAKIYAQTGEREKAKQVMQRLLEREPRNETAQKILRELQ
jgi:tetratricopeptide (TPR) repeat protein